MTRHLAALALLVTALASAPPAHAQVSGSCSAGVSTEKCLLLKGGTLTGPVQSTSPSNYLFNSALERSPTVNDGASAGYPTGTFWLAPSGQVFTSLASTTGAAAWSQRALVSSAIYDFIQVLPCDIAATKLCYATRLLKTGYAGHALNVVPANTGSGVDIDFLASGALDVWTLWKNCALTICRIATWYDQSSKANDATSTVVAKTTNGANVAGNPLLIANTSSIVAGMYIDVVDGTTSQPKANCVGTHVGAIVVNTSVEAVTYDSAHPCAAASGDKLLFSNAPTITTLNRVGSLYSVVFDRPADNRTAYAQQLVIPAFSGAETVPSNDHTILFAARTQEIMNINFFSLFTAGAGSNGEAWGCNQGACGVHHVDSGNNWVDAFDYTNAYAYAPLTPFLAWIQSSSTGTAGFNETSAVGSNSYSTRSNTLTGGTLGYANVIGAGAGQHIGFNGSVEFSEFILYSAALPTTLLPQAKAAVIATSGLPAQVRDPHLHIVYDDQAQGSVTTNLQDYPRQIADQYPGWRVTSNGATSAGTAAIVCAYALHPTTLITNFAVPNIRNNIGLITASPNGWGTISGNSGTLTSSITGGSVRNIAVTGAGANYTTGTFALELADATGTGGSGFYTIGTNGGLTNVTLNLGSGGSGYASGATGTYSLGFMWGGLQNAVGTYHLTAGVIDAVAFSAPGNSGTPGTYRLSFSGTTGTPATATYTVGSANTITGGAPVNPGSAYTAAPAAIIPLYDPAVEEACHSTLWNTMLVSPGGYSAAVEVIHPVSSNFAGIPGNDTYYIAVNNWIIANAPAAGVALARVWDNPFFSPGTASVYPQWCSQSGYDFTAACYSIEMETIMQAVLPLVK